MNENMANLLGRLFGRRGGPAGKRQILAGLGKPVDALRDLARVASSGLVRVVAAPGQPPR